MKGNERVKGVLQSLMAVAKDNLVRDGSLGMATLVIGGGKMQPFLLDNRSKDHIQAAMVDVSMKAKEAKADYVILIADSTDRNTGKDGIVVYAYGPDINTVLSQPYHREGEKFVFDGEPQNGELLMTGFVPWWDQAPHEGGHA